MQRFFTRTHLYAVLLAVPLLVVGCTNQVTCHELSGRWTTHEGQELLFQNGGKGMWLTRFGSQYDTVWFDYLLDCKPDPATIELGRFLTGPYSGKTLYGILEWTSDTSFRMQYQPGTGAEARPTEFDNESTLKFTPAR